MRLKKTSIWRGAPKVSGRLLSTSVFSTAPGMKKSVEASGLPSAWVRTSCTGAPRAAASRWAEPMVTTLPPPRTKASICGTVFSAVMWPSQP
ncbi:hypothetical protein D3C73_1282380 [compost metagenome]